jgi:hypothetical protein
VIIVVLSYIPLCATGCISEGEKGEMATSVRKKQNMESYRGKGPGIGRREITG